MTPSRTSMPSACETLGCLIPVAVVIIFCVVTVLPFVRMPLTSWKNTRRIVSVTQGDSTNSPPFSVYHRTHGGSFGSRRILSRSIYVQAYKFICPGIYCRPASPAIARRKFFPLYLFSCGQPHRPFFPVFPDSGCLPPLRTPHPCASPTRCSEGLAHRSQNGLWTSQSVPGHRWTLIGRGTSATQS